MKRALIVSIRVILVLIVILAIAVFASRTWFRYESQQAIQQSVVAQTAMVTGNVNGSFPVVEFFDYRCPHCATLTKIAHDALGSDPTIKFILRPVAVRDGDSFKIAKLVLAAYQQDPQKAIMLHNQLLKEGIVPDYATAVDFAGQMGFDLKKLEELGDSPAINAQMLENADLIKNIGFYAVPAMVIGDKGFLPVERMPSINELKLMVMDAKERLSPTQ